MGLLDRLLGRTSTTNPQPTAYGRPSYAGSEPAGAGPRTSEQSEDERAVARYKYLLRTATPDQLEQVHAEAFARLTPAQRQQLLRELSTNLPAGEQVASDQPADLARAATRAEMRQPGFLQGTLGRSSFGGGYGGMGMGGTIMGSMMGTIGGVIIGSAIADALFDGFDSSPEASAAGDDSGSTDAADADGSSDSGSAGSDPGGYDAAGDAGGYDSGGSDFGGFDGGGSDFGGGDFGGGF